ncbi:MAG: hypothetical protein ACR2QE_17935 [Acidimicrobiales bacterium]
MPKYVLAYHGGGGMPETEAEQAELMKTWGAWFGDLGEALVDGGNPISSAVTIASDGSTSAGGGANPLTGYSLINAGDIDAAVKLASGCPVLAGGGQIEVAEAIDM